jgi:hypothetical protein
MRFLDNLDEWLAEMKQEVQDLPEELDSIVARLDRGKLQDIRFRLEQEFDQYINKTTAFQNPRTINLPLIFDLDSPGLRPITDQDLSRWREAHKSEVRVVIGQGQVEVLPVSEIADKLGTKFSQITLAAQRKGYVILSWDQYQRLLDEIGKLINSR